ncbi:MAG TPA: ABC transporter ATP-binding protein [Chitinispirillaceae bacterium]|nr:ABC transporter ATP-binding protein [Chitinispirillaceae bacterium]
MDNVSGFQKDGQADDLPGLHIENVTFSYNREDTILQDISLDVRQGEFICLLGLSGSGKSTLLRLIAGLEYPDKGNFYWKGNPISGPGIDRGLVFQDYSLFPWMTVRDNLMLAIDKKFPEISRTECLSCIDEYLELVGLRNKGKCYPGELSGGMRQRAAIARSLALGSEMLLLDEPFGALDPANRAHLQDLLLQIWRGSAIKRTVIFVTHDVEEALYLGERIVVLGTLPGRIIADVPVDIPHPRNRQDLFSSALFKRFSEQIVGYFHSDMEKRLNTFASTGYGAFI